MCSNKEKVKPVSTGSSQLCALRQQILKEYHHVDWIKLNQFISFLILILILIPYLVTKKEISMSCSNLDFCDEYRVVVFREEMSKILDISDQR